GSFKMSGLLTFGIGPAVTKLSVAGGDFTLLPNTPTPALQSLSFSGGGRLDITNNALVGGGAVGSWDGSTYTGVTGQIRSGRNGANWSGCGTATSPSNATQGILTSTGIATAAQVKGVTGSPTSLWTAPAVISGSTLVMYTYGGDAN